MIESLTYTSGESLFLHLQKDFIRLFVGEKTKSNEYNANEVVRLMLQVFLYLNLQGFKKLFLGDKPFFNGYNSETLVSNFYSHVILRVESFNAPGESIPNSPPIWKTLNSPIHGKT